MPTRVARPEGGLTMERLTMWYDGNHAICQNEDCDRPDCPFADPVCKQVQDIIDRLATYEETGLEPEEIKRIYQEWSHYLNFAGERNAIEGAIEDIYDDGNIDYNRLRELAQADREGRCVVLPCKVEDDVYINILGRTLPFTVISISQMASTPTFKAQHGIRLVYIFKADDVGETVFLTRAEAQAALRREQDGE